MKLKGEILVVLVLVALLIFLNYPYLDGFLETSFDNSEYGIVERVIDGDTLVINGTSIRLLGINSPEKGEKGYTSAMEFLRNKTLDKEVRLVFGKEKFDLYKRKLAYVFVAGENVNRGSVENGYSNFYFPSGKDQFYYEFYKAWENCINKNINLCEKSDDACFYLDDWDVSGQKVVLKNKCPYVLNITGWSVKDEGRKKYVFGEKVLLGGEEIVLTNEDWGESYVWTESGDSIFIRDDEGKLVYWESY